MLVRCFGVEIPIFDHFAEADWECFWQYVRSGLFSNPECVLLGIFRWQPQNQTEVGVVVGHEVFGCADLERERRVDGARTPLMRFCTVTTFCVVKEVFRNADSALVGLYQSILEDAGIATFVGNTGTQQSLVGGLATALFPLPIFFPTLYALNDDDYPEAMEILRGIAVRPSFAAEDWKCAQCGESVPDNFDSCWKCQAPRKSDVP